MASRDPWPAVVLHAREVHGYAAVLVQNADSREDAAQVAAGLMAEARRLLVEEVAAWLVATFQNHRYDGWDNRKPMPEDVEELAAEVRRRFGEPKP